MEIPKENLSRFQVPGGEHGYSVELSVLKKLFGDSANDLRAAMVACLENKIWPACLLSNRGAFSLSDQIKLLQSSAAIIGAGGLGGTVVHGLARIGVGRLSICDGDTFEESNLNRQLLARLDRLGINKARCAADEIAVINPAIQVRVFDQWADETTFPEILEGCQIAVDCLDNMTSRYHLQSAAERMGIPFVHGSVGGMEGFVMIIPPGEAGLTKLYGPEIWDAAVDDDSNLGFPYFTPAMVANLQVKLAVMMLLGRQETCAEKVFHIDMNIPAIDHFHLPNP
jgi:molybdopterin/thiamine biosynthesis adenylyltransferase